MSLHSADAANYAERTAGTFINPASNFTVCLWAKVDDIPATALVKLYESTDSANIRFGFYITTAGQIQFYATDDNGSTDENIVINYILGRPQHLVVTYDTAASTFSFYADSLFIGSVVLDISAATFDAEYLLRGTGATSFDVNAQYLRIWNRKLSQDEIETVMKSATAGAASSSRILNCPLTTDLLDTSGNGNDFVVVAAPDFEATIALIDYRLAIGGWTRFSPYTNLFSSLGSTGNPNFVIYTADGTIIAALTPGLITQTVVGTTLTVSSWHLRVLVGTSPNTYQITEVTPWPDPLLGLDISPATEPRSNEALHQIGITIKTATRDIAAAAYLGDGEVKLYIDEVLVDTVSSLNINLLFGTSNQIKVRIWPAADMDGIFIIGNAVMPTFAGAEEVPSSDWLIDYFDFNDEVYLLPGWTETDVFGAPPPGAMPGFTDNGLDDTPAIGKTDAPSNSYTGLNRSQMTSPLFSQVIAASAPASTGNLIVNKVTEPVGDPQSFDFTAGGGLSPGTFSLEDGGSQIFTGIAAGTYSIVEDQVDDWNAPEYTVSNGSPNAAITVAAGENVTVEVFNSKRVEGSGLYKLSGLVGDSENPIRRNDQIVNTSGVFVDTAIPNPYIETALLPTEDL
jgi:hypothetical protein